MIERTYLDKCNTIIKGSNVNTGISPVLSLNYGASTTRALIHFDHSKIKKLYECGVMPDMLKMKHTLKITNAGSLDFTQIHTKEQGLKASAIKKRATSFDVIFFLLPQLWDQGKGFDYVYTDFNRDFYDRKSRHIGNRLVSTDGSNWYQARNGYKWPENGVYSLDTLSKEYDNYSSEEGSKIVIGRQHFDIGNENIEFDITEIFNKFITSEIENYGIGIAFSPLLENIGNVKSDPENKFENYIGFLSNNTNLFFEPYVETFYDDYISDDRANFVIDKNNKLYLYCTIGDKLEDLDELPSCTITNQNEDIVFDNMEVKRFSKGVYYVELMCSHGNFEPDTMLYDTWGNIIYNGVKLDDVEMDFTLKKPSSYFKIGKSIIDEPDFTPNIYGINSNEEIQRGDIRKLTVITRVNYTVQQAQSVDSIEARVYIRDGEREYDVIPFEKLNKTISESYLLVDTSMLLPQKYYVDVKINYGMQSIIHHDMLHFSITDNLNNKFA